MYFVIGGRNTQSGLYRVSYTGKETMDPATLHDEAGAQERQLRHELEAFHGKVDAKAVATAWPHLNSDDPFLRYAARIALEWQPVHEWKARRLDGEAADRGSDRPAGPGPLRPPRRAGRPSYRAGAFPALPADR